MSSAVLALAVLGVSQLALASDGCATSYERAQELKLEGDLLGSREELLQCSQASCAAFMQQDCARWLSEVEAALPSLTFAAKDDTGRDLTAVRITVNGQVLMTRLDGRALPVNPGRYEIVFEAAGYTPFRSQLFVSEGQKGRLVQATLRLPQAAPGAPESAATVEERSPSRLPAYVLGSVGVVGLAGFGIFALSGANAEDDLRGSPCARDKTCTDAQTDPVERKYLLADLSLGVGVLALGAAAYFWFATPERDGESERRTSVDVQVGPGGAYAGVSTRY